jgi:hypothetical protein
MKKAISLLFIFSSVWLSGCQAPAAKRAARYDDAARVLADFVVFRQRLPGSQADLVAAAGTYADRAAVRSLHQVSFRALAPSIARMDFKEASGVSDYRIVVVTAPRAPRLTVGPEVFPDYVLTDRKVLHAMYHGHVPPTATEEKGATQ